HRHLVEAAKLARGGRPETPEIAVRRSRRPAEPVVERGPRHHPNVEGQVRVDERAGRAVVERRLAAQAIGHDLEALRTVRRVGVETLDALAAAAGAEIGLAIA